MKPFAAWLSLALATPAIAHADVILEHPLATTGASYQSAWLSPDGLDWDAWCWDSFSVGTAETVTDIEWFGTRANDIGSFSIRLDHSIGSGTQPDVLAQPWASWTVSGDANPVLAGTFNGVPIYRYSYHLPQGFALTAGTVYWLQIEAAENAGNGWSWAVGTTGNGSHFTKGPAFYAGNVSYYVAGSDLAFRLLGATLDVPVTGAFAFALDGATPNPAPGGLLRVAYTLPEAAPASLELFDVKGRRVASADAARAGAGRHVVDLAADHTVAPGLYFARLTQGTRALQARIVVTR